MKLMFASDIHGSAYYCDKIKEIYKKEKSDNHKSDKLLKKKKTIRNVHPKKR